ncbi:hypothetical protein AVP_165 [Aerococcus phage vB_AviM_AVP]|nr:hypothetical protein AVP_165 [Aerococcus phage vB_AviM_AVP]
MTNTIKLQTSYMDDIFYSELSEIRFTDDKSLSNLEDLVNNSRVNNMGLNSIDLEELFAKYLEGQEEKYTRILLEGYELNGYYELEDIEDNDDFRDLLEDNRDYLEELLYIISQEENKSEDDIINELLNQVDYTFDTVGYSGWSYYIAPNDLDYNYIYDLYHGYNFYTVELIQNGESLEITDFVYLNSLKELDDFIQSTWNLEEYEIDQEDLEEYEELV